MKILVWHGKYDPCYYDASTPEKEQKAWLAVFSEQDDFGMFNDIEPDYIEELGKKAKELRKVVEDSSKLTLPKALLDKLNEERRRLKYMERELSDAESDITLYNEALSGSWKSARHLIRDRSGGEYARVEEVHVK